MGAIGMTYEQAGHGRAGLGVNTDEGTVLTLVDRMQHHTTTGLSTVEVASKNTEKLNNEFKTYFNNTQLRYKSYVLNGNSDKLKKLTNLLDKHEITWGYSVGKSASGYHYGAQQSGSINAENGIIVSTNQPKGKMVKVLFEPDTKLSNPLTYDITSWSLPYAYGLETVASTSLLKANGIKNSHEFHNKPSPKSVGYICKWNSMNDAAFLVELLKNDIKVRFSEKELSFNSILFDRGSLIITRSDNKNKVDFDKIVTDIANKQYRKLVASPSSFSDNGTDFGSPDIKLVNKQRIAVLKGEGVSSLSYGAIWYFFETELKYPLTSIDTNDFRPSSLEKFDVLILPETYYWEALDENSIKTLKSWIQKGGKLIAMGSSVGLFNGKEGFGISINNELEKEEIEDDLDLKLQPYDQREINNVKNFITGSIYKVTIDNTHPMAFGYSDTYYSLKQGKQSYQFLDSGYNVGYLKGDAVSVSGFSGKEAIKTLKNSIVFAEKRMGSGSIIYLVDDVLFRSFWENGKLFFINSIFFVNNNKVRI